jgi:ABC-type xylose transport system permease subunit
MEENASVARSDEPRATTPIKDDDAIPQDERLATIVFAAVLMLFGIFWVWASSDLPSRQQTAYLSQGFLPITAGFLLAGLSCLLLIGTSMTKSRPATELGRPPLFQAEAEARAAGIFLALLAYILLLPHIHYLLSTFLLMLAGLAVAREPLRPRLFILAAVMSLIFYGIFVWGIKLPLPGSGLS